MKNFKIRILSLGVLSTVMLSSTPVFAKTNSLSENKVVTTASAESEVKNIIAAANSSSPNKNVVLENKKIQLSSVSPENYPKTANEYFEDDGGIVQYGDSGYVVKIVQRCLITRGYSVTMDGKFGSETRRAVKNFQRKKHLTVDGIVGLETWNELKY